MCPCLDDPENGYVFPVADGKSFVFSCKSGYTFNDDAQILLTCNNGTWSAPPPKCVLAG